MTSTIKRAVMATAVVCATAVASLAQQSVVTSTETKAFEVLAVSGNQVVVTLPEGTLELTVPDDFPFNVDGQTMSVHELTAGMRGTATITTRVTATPVTVTTVKSGTVMVQNGGNIIVRTDEGIKSFTAGDADKRGVKIMRDGKQVALSELRQGDVLSATIITTAEPIVVTDKEVTAILTRSAAPPVAQSTIEATAPEPALPSEPALPPVPVATSGTLPKTASTRPLFALMSIVALAVGLGLTIRRRAVQ